MRQNCKRLNVFSDLLKIARIFWSLLRVLNGFIKALSSTFTHCNFCNLWFTAGVNYQLFACWQKRYAPEKNDAIQYMNYCNTSLADRCRFSSKPEKLLQVQKYLSRPLCEPPGSVPSFSIIASNVFVLPGICLRCIAIPRPSNLHSSGKLLLMAIWTLFLFFTNSSQITICRPIWLMKG